MSSWLPAELAEVEVAVLSLMLDEPGDFRAAVRHQLSHASAGKRDLTGAGFYRDFVIPDDAPIARDLPRTEICGVLAENPALECGAMFVLFLRDGVVSFLEGVTFAGQWPGDESAFTFFLDFDSPKPSP